MLKPLRLLIVEDSESDAQLLLRLFKKAGCQVVSLRVQTRDTMAAALAHDTWDCVTADHNMPDFDAFVALETLQASSMDIPFIVVSGSIGEEAAVALMKAGAADYVMKDKLARLPAVVERELSDAAARRERLQAIDALRASEEKYRQLYDLESDALFLIERESGRILEANAGATALYGYGHDEWLTMRNVDVSAEPENTTAATRDRLTEIPVRWHRKKDGTVFPVDIAASHFQWEGRAVHLAAIRDITERRHLEQEVAHLASFPRQNPNPVIELGIDGLVSFANKAAIDALARLGRNSDARQFLPGTPEELSLLRSKCEEKPWTQELHLGDSTFILTVSASAEDTLRVFATDITERKRTEEALRESEERFAKAFRDAPMWIAITDLADGVYVDVNEETLRVSGFSREDVIGHTAEEIGWLAAGQRARLVSEIEEHERIAGLEMEFRAKDGRTLCGWLKGERIVLSGRPCLLTVTVDITDRKQMEEERDLTVRILDILNSPGSLHELMRSVMTLLQEWTGYEAVGIRLHQGEDYPYFETRGFPASFVELESSLCATDQNGQLLRDDVGNPMLECMCGNVLCRRFDPTKPFFTAHGSFWSNCTTGLLATTTEADRQARTRNRCNGEGYESVALIPLRSGGATLGLLQFNDHRPGRFTPGGIRLFERLADSLAMALGKSMADEALRESESRLRRAEGVAHFGNWEVNMAARTLRASRGASLIYGLQGEEWPLADVKALALSEYRPMMDAAFANLIEHHQPYNVEFRIRRPSDGQLRHINSIGEYDPIRGVIFGVINDITERKQAEESLLQQTEELRARNDELNRFNRLAVGRELRMIELKREVNELSARLGEPRRHRLAEDEPAR